eukprot:12425779-Karenia_brevis.AAC.1
MERYRGSKSHQAIVSFGEQVLYKPAKTVKVHKDDPRWEYGTWLGVSMETREHIVGTSKGVIRCRAITALEEEKKFQADKINEMQGTPWQPVPGRKTNRIPTRIAEAEDGEVEDDEVDPVEEENFEIQVDDAAEEDDDFTKPDMSGRPA